MNVLTYQHPSWLTNCYLLFADGSPDAILIDAGAPVEHFEDDIDRNNLELKGIFLTHHHGDHTTHLGSWIKKYSSPVFGHSIELEPYGLNQHALTEGELCKVGNFQVRALFTPGHTSGHFCYLVNEALLFTGDLLFQGSVGGTVAKGHGTFEQLRDSVMKKVLRLPGHTVVYPGHAGPTTVGDELKSNPFVLAWSGKQELNTRLCKVGERDAELLLLATDYDGGKKAWIQFIDETGRKHDEVVPGSWIESD